jgi:hypothetical protein
MTGTRWQKINEIFEAAVKLAPAERDIYIKRACTGEESLRAEIETLLAAHSRAGESRCFFAVTALNFRCSPILQFEVII